MMKFVLDGFLFHFMQKGYRYVSPVPISSKVDKSVVFIGSHISTLKPYLENENIPTEGVYIIQPCIRTQTLKYIMDDNNTFSFGTFFRSLGVLVCPKKKYELAFDSIELLTERFNINKSDIVIRVHDSDDDLYAIASFISKEKGIKIESNAMPEKYYRHSFGIDGVKGRNFNFAIKRNGIIQDLGNYIFIEKESKLIGVELALGSSVLVREKNNLSHCCFSEQLNIVVNDLISYKFHDAILAATHLLSEGLKPSANKNHNRALRLYIISIAFYAKRYGVKFTEVKDSVIFYENRHGLNKLASNMIVEYLEEYNNYNFGKKK